MEKIEISPCGVICSECSYYPDECKGCRQIEGKVFWLQYFNIDVCNRYKCCVNDSKYSNCSKCDKLPCDYFYEKDPNLTVKKMQRD